MIDHAVPVGFVIDQRRSSGLFGIIGPLYARRDEGGVVVAIRVDERHLNSRGFLHGGVGAALLDVALSDNISACGAPGNVTATLTVQYLARSRPGDWLEGSASGVSIGRRVAQARGELRADDAVIAFATASYAVLATPNDPAPPDVEAR